MAGSYRHVIEDDGSLSSNRRVVGMLENGGDVYEAIEEMYGIIWYLATNGQLQDAMNMTPTELIEDARVYYKLGLEASPTKRFQAPGDDTNDD